MTLHLVLDYKWFDMIAAGEKLEEYREMTDYWKKRIWDKRGEIESVCFHRGYSPVTITRRVFAIVQDAGREEWGAYPLTLYYVIKLMKSEQVWIEKSGFESHDEVVEKWPVENHRR